MIGDSGEQDLTLYVQLAQEYGERIIAIYIRDVTTPFIPIIEDPIFTDEPAAIDSTIETESRAQDIPGSLGNDRDSVSRDGLTARPRAPRRSQTEPIMIKPSSGSTPQFQTGMNLRSGRASVEERVEVELSEQRVALIEEFYARIARAESQLKRAGSTRLRIFRHGGECQEEANIWIKENME